MTIEEVWAYLQEELDELIDVDVETLSLDSPLDALKIDSLSTVQIQIALKRRYGVEIPESLLVPEAQSRVRDICQTVVDGSPHAAA